MKNRKRCLAAALATVMCLNVLGIASQAEAAKAKPKLAKNKLSVQAGKSKTLKVKKAKGWKIQWKSNKKSIAAVKKSGKYTCKVNAKKKGSAVVTCKVTKGKRKYSLKCKVTVTKKERVTPPVVSEAPTASPSGSVAPTVTPSAVPSETPESSPSTTPGLTAPDSLKEAYKDIVPHMGTCVNYSNGQLKDDKTLAHMKQHYNSFTLENESKPDTILRGSANLITKEEAEGLGYILPDNYAEEKVPKLNLDPLDKAMEIAYKNGLQMRFHTFVWHSQTPEWFFAEDYNTSNNVVTPEVMDAREEFYIRTVMKHVFEKEKELTGREDGAGELVYAWDVVNEYVHRSYFGRKGWDTVYGDLKLEPAYVKRAFEIAYDMLKQYGAENKSVLVSNDYDTYFNVDKEIKLVEYINKDEKDENGNPVTICGGIGMQSHVDIDRPTIEQYGKALDAFLATGLEVQITELDITINFGDLGGGRWGYKNAGRTNDDQAVFVKDFMEMIVNKHKNRDQAVNPKGVTGITLWGLYDSVSWRRECQPLLFGKGIDDPKPSYQKFLDASLVWYQ